MPITRIKEKEGPDKTLCWLKVIVAGAEGEEEKKVFEEGERIRNVLRKLQVLGFRVNHGLPVKAKIPYYFFIVECLPKRRDITEKTIWEIAEAGGEFYHEHRFTTDRGA